MQESGDLLRSLVAGAPDAPSLTVDPSRRWWIDADALHLFRSDRGRLVHPIHPWQDSLPAAQAARADSTTTGSSRSLPFDDLVAAAEAMGGVRQGWVYLQGVATIDGRATPVDLPLLSQPVSLVGRGTRSARVTGDRTVFELIADPDDRAELEMSAEFAEDPADPVLHGWIDDVVTTAGLRIDAIMGLDDLRAWAPDGVDSGLVAVVATALHVQEGPGAPGPSGSLAHWADLPIEPTAFGAFTNLRNAAASHGRPSNAGPATSAAPLVPIFPLPRNTARVLADSREEPLRAIAVPDDLTTLVGSAVAVDELARGNTALIAVSDERVLTAFVELLDEYDAPRPAVFGSSEHRDLASEHLLELVSDPLSDIEARRFSDEAERATGDLAALVAALEHGLDAEQRYLDAATRRAEIAQTLAGLPAPLLGEQLDTVEGLIARAATSGVRARRARRRLAAACGLEETDDLARCGDVVTAARDQELLAATDRSDGWSLGERLADLEQRETAAARAVAAAVDAQVRVVGSADTQRRQLVERLGRALRSGRGARRRFFTDVPIVELVRAVPLWLGTTADVDDLLPAVPGLFDVVVTVGADDLSLARSAGALLRSRRALLMGPPEPHDSGTTTAFRTACDLGYETAIFAKEDVPDADPRASDAAAAGWTTQIAEALGRAQAGIIVRDQRAGPWTVDLSVGTGTDQIFVTTVPHPDGPTAHLERARALERLGQPHVDVFASRWLDRPDAAAAHVLAARPERGGG